MKTAFACDMSTTAVASQQVDPRLDLGLESELSDKKGLRQQIGRLLSALPEHEVESQCPSEYHDPI